MGDILGQKSFTQNFRGGEVEKCWAEILKSLGPKLLGLKFEEGGAQTLCPKIVDPKFEGGGQKIFSTKIFGPKFEGGGKLKNFGPKI